jgi:cytochrome P450
MAEIMNIRLMGMPENPYPTYKILRKKHPVYYDNDMDEWIVSRYKDVLCGLKRDDLFGVEKNMFLPTWLKPECRRNYPMIFEDPPRHSYHRNILKNYFSPRAIKKWGGELQETSQSIIRNIPANEPIDFLDICFGYSTRTISQLLGVDLKHYPGNILNWVRVFEKFPRSEPQDDIFIGELENAIETNVTHLNTLVNASNTALIADLKSSGMSTDRIVLVIEVLLLAGLQATARMLSICLLELSSRPELVLKLKKHSELTPLFINEAMRFNGTEQYIYRRALTEVTFQNTVIQPESTICLAIGAANRDGEVFADPDVFNIVRANNSRHLTFGGGIHRCLGATLARTEMDIFLRALLEKFSFFHIDRKTLAWWSSAAARGVDDMIVTFE